jgi:hypothetical protein
MQCSHIASVGSRWRSGWNTAGCSSARSSWPAFARGLLVAGLDWVQREFVTDDPRPADTLPP